MTNNSLPEQEVLRIVLLGLPYSGEEDVANVLHEVYGCTIFRADLAKKPEGISIEKYIREICFEPYAETLRAVVLISHHHSSALRELKKRNYVNIVLVDAPFHTRYKEYLKCKGLENNHQTVSDFMLID
jgi:hypothetical protein